MKTKQTILIILILLVTAIIVFAVYKRFDLKKEKWNPKPEENIVAEGELFDYNIVHLVNEENTNYMISPYSMAYALTILKNGADGETKKQIEKALKNYNLEKTINIKDRIAISNALFIKNEYKNDINNNYITNIRNDFDSEIIFDDFLSPKPLNDWTYNKTYGMIDKVVDQIDKDFVLGIINAIAIDVEWKNQFIEGYTNKKIFNKIDGTTKEVDMMHDSDNVTYISNNNAKGIVRDYKKYNDVELEFIAIMPNDNIKEYINKFDKAELDSLLNNKRTNDSRTEISLSIPKFKFDYDYKNFMEDLKKLGIKDAFDKDIANFKPMLNDNSLLELYVGEAVHKAHIDLSEYGTKAAAVTYFGMYKNTAMPMETEKINIVFDRPFLFIIKEKNKDNVWFFGTVYEP